MITSRLHILHNQIPRHRGEPMGPQTMPTEFFHTHLQGQGRGGACGRHCAQCLHIAWVESG